MLGIFETFIDISIMKQVMIISCKFSTNYITCLKIKKSTKAFKIALDNNNNHTFKLYYSSVHSIILKITENGLL